jgi:hypothetical protein
VEVCFWQRLANTGDVEKRPGDGSSMKSTAPLPRRELLETGETGHLLNLEKEKFLFLLGKNK